MNEMKWERCHDKGEIEEEIIIIIIIIIIQ